MNEGKIKLLDVQNSYLTRKDRMEKGAGCLTASSKIKSTLIKNKPT